MRRGARTFILCTALGALVAGLWAEHALSRLAARARSLPARWRRPEGRHTHREIPPHPRPAIFGPGIDPPSVPVAPWPPLPEPGFDVWAVPMAGEHLMSPAEVTDMDVKPPLRRPYTDCPREGRWVA